MYDLQTLAPAEVIALPEGEVFGSLVLSPDNSQGLLYSTASMANRYASWNRVTGEVDLHPSVKPIDGIRVSPDGGVALLAHDADNGETEPDSPVYNQHAIPLVDLGDFFANPIRLPAEPTSFSATEDGDLGFVVMEGESALVQLDYRSLIHDEVRLRSGAVHMGVRLRHALRLREPGARSRTDQLLRPRPAVTQHHHGLRAQLRIEVD